MKIPPIFLVVFFSIQALVANAQRGPQVIFPSTPFNKEEAKHLLEDGTSTIKGVRLQKSNYMYNLVILFPCTTYFNEWLELKKKDRKGKKNIEMSDEAYSYRIMTIINGNDGTFEFKGLKPGKYFLQTTVTQTHIGTEEKTVGTETTTTRNGYGQVLSSSSRPIKQKQNALYQTSELHTAFVEITADGQVVNVTL